MPKVPKNAKVDPDSGKPYACVKVEVTKEQSVPLNVVENKAVITPEKVTAVSRLEDGTKEWPKVSI